MSAKSRKNSYRKETNFNKKAIALDDITIEFLKNMRSIRKNLGFSQAAIAKAVGYERTTIVAVELGHAYPCLELLLRLADFFHFDISQSINYKFFHRKIDTARIKKSIRLYGLSFKEISHITGYCPEFISSSVRMKPDASAICLQAILNVLRKERIAFLVREHLIAGTRQYSKSKKEKECDYNS